MMQNKENFLFGFDFNTEDSIKLKQDPQHNDIENLEKVVLQSFKYCQAKKSKNRYIRSKKVQEMKNYQKKLISIIKKKSEEMISTLTDYSTLLIKTQENDENQIAIKDQQTLTILKQKISSLKSTPFQQQNKNSSSSQQLHQKIKRITLQCEQQLQKMQQKDKKTDDQIQKLITEMQRPFKKLCSYFSMMTKQIKEQ